MSKNPPPKEIPAELLSDFTLDGKVKVEHWYFDQAFNPEGAREYSKEIIESLIAKATRREQNYYEATDGYLYTALERFPIKDKSVVVMGSWEPWYESVALAFGAAECVTIEYAPIVCHDPRVTIISPRDFYLNPRKFDAAFSISSFEHDGLGRYGDPIKPDADLLAMQKMKEVLKPDGLLYLAVPVGVDKLVWNAHRIYGKLRLPLMLQGWEVLDVIGMQTGLLERDTGTSGEFQPVWVLKNN